MKTIMIMICLFLSACATSPVVQKVDVPVLVKCVKSKPIRPDYETRHLDKDATSGQKVIALSRDWIQSRKYEGQLEAVVQGCE